MTFEELSVKYANREPAFPSHLDPPNQEDLSYIQLTYKCRFPESFVKFQLEYFDKTPIGDLSFTGFGWANRNLEPYMSLLCVVRDYRELKFPEYLSPFREDNGDFWCFDTRYEDQDGEFPVVIWSHNDYCIEKDPKYHWKNFMDWLDSTMEEE